MVPKMHSKTPEKLYFSIGEVAEELNVNPSLIRFWEKKFDQIKPKKNKKGDRFFTKNDVKLLKTIYHLAKERGYTLEGIRKKLNANRNEVEETQEVIEKLTQIRSFLLELKENI